ncbi:F-box/LRR-repeat protein 25 [Helianthus annuus]|uniref:F-box/LRR-repeat protein 25 n=1 Tax=Helianthus annuus TaxID=4232 RepID=UPI000B909C33|nr:F-box/LRR-repeat protein 25 [Helianthus annuus]
MLTEELVEEGIRFEDKDEDLISKLPDCILVEIVSRLPTTKEAIRTGTLSKRWEHLWTSVSNLVFLDHNENKFVFDFFSFVDKTLTQRPRLKLYTFKLHTYYNSRLYGSHIQNWIRYAVTCNVEHLILRLWNRGYRNEFPLDQFVFINSCFTHVTLSCCAFNPTGAISWKNLRKFCIAYGKFDEDFFENVSSGSPMLETLELKYCYGYTRLNITSKSVKNLVFEGYAHACYCDIIEFNAPNILTLIVQDVLVLRKFLLLNVSSLVEAHLDYTIPSWEYETTPEEAEEEMLKGFILNLRHVKHLKVGISCSKVLDRLKAKGFLSPLNLKDPSDTSPL